MPTGYVWEEIYGWHNTGNSAGAVQQVDESARGKDADTVGAEAGDGGQAQHVPWTGDAGAVPGQRSGGFRHGNAGARQAVQS